MKILQSVLDTAIISNYNFTVLINPPWTFIQFREPAKNKNSAEVVELIRASYYYSQCNAICHIYQTEVMI